MAMFSNIVQGALGNYSEKTPAELTNQYKDYLFDGEKITMGYQLIRDAIIFTNYRIIFVDKQGATGKKTSYKSIHLESIVDVEMETAGFGIDDSEIEISCLENVYQRPHNEVLIKHKFEFPKKTDILPLYRFLGNISLENRHKINQ